MRHDSRFNQMKQEIAAAQACLDDARTAIADFLEESPPLNALEAADLAAARAAINASLFKARNAYAALSRLVDRSERSCTVSRIR